MLSSTFASLLFFSFACFAYGQHIITTIAGTGTQGYSGDNGPATNAYLNEPSAVHADTSGNLFIADLANRRIRKVDLATGVITTIAGTGTQGFSGDNGPATGANLNTPSAVHADTSGNLFIADNGIHCVRKVDLATGVITTIAGIGQYGYSGDDGQATSAELNNPVGVCVDTSGNLYIADRNNQRIRKVVLVTGVITTIAGTGERGYSGDDGPATSAKLNEPYGVSADTSGNLFIADRNNQRIRKVYLATGVITTIAGTGVNGYSGDNGLAISAVLSNPAGLSADTSGNLFIVDRDNQRIRKVVLVTGVITTFAGTGVRGYSGDDGPATSAQFATPYGVSVDISGNLFIVDLDNERIRKVALATGTIAPSLDPSISPSVEPSYLPTIQLSANPSITPSLDPSIAPSVEPSYLPTIQLSANPSIAPSVGPTYSPFVVSLTLSPSQANAVDSERRLNFAVGFGLGFSFLFVFACCCLYASFCVAHKKKKEALDKTQAESKEIEFTKVKTAEHL